MPLLVWVKWYPMATPPLQSSRRPIKFHKNIPSSMATCRQFAYPTPNLLRPAPPNRSFSQDQRPGTGVLIADLGAFSPI